MAYSVEKILSDARRLAARLREHDSVADSVIIRTQTLQRQIEAMKQFQENLNELNEIARHRPRASLILGLAQENCQIRDLQAENKELRQSLEEHQSALELIMSKYREQVSRLVRVNRMNRSIDEQQVDRSKEMQDKLDKIQEMAAVMRRAVEVDDLSVDRDQEMIAQLMIENRSMRQLLSISTEIVSRSAETSDRVTQTEDTGPAPVTPASMTSSVTSVAQSSEDDSMCSSSTDSLTSVVSALERSLCDDTSTVPL